jgi:hypothetical protein
VHRKVKLDKDFLEQLRVPPRKAVLELIWNALDADADVVQVVFKQHELEGIESITVSDNGHGMTFDEAMDAFSRLGGSWKGTATGTRGKLRTLHGKKGRGRFFAAALAGRTRWETVAESEEEVRLTVITIRGSLIDDFEIEDRGQTDRPVGAVVTLDSFSEPPVGVTGTRVPDTVLAEFAIYLTKYPIELTYDGYPIDPRALQKALTSYTIEVESDLPAELDVVEWKRDLGRRMYLCDYGGTSLADIRPGVRAPGFDFTAYVRWDGFASDSALDLAQLSFGVTADLLEGARQHLRRHFRMRADEERRTIVESWKAEQVYPYDEPPADEVEETSRELFDVVAITAREALGDDRKTRRFTLRLLREALERDPGHLRRVLEEVLDLDATTLADLTALLDRTSLAAVVAAARSITDRLDFIRALEEMVFEPEVKGRVLERTQLHRMLATETWLFGEEYHLVADDESLTNVLRRHLEALGRAQLAPEPVTDESGRTRIVDLMFAKSLEEAQNRREHLVIELKAPRVNLGHAEVDQIRDYAQAVANDPQFDKQSTHWDFWVISTEMRDVVRRQANQRHRPPGLLDDYEDVNVRIWARTWGQVIQDARHRLKFLRGQLQYTSGRDQALEYLRTRHRAYVPEPLREEPEAEGA